MPKQSVQKGNPGRDGTCLGLREEDNVKAGDGFTNPGPAAVNPLGRAGRTSLQATMEETKQRAGGEPPPLSPTCQHRR